MVQRFIIAFFVRWNLVEFSSTAYNDKSCLAIVGFCDVGGLDQAHEVSINPYENFP